jgi:hypothetical protein
MIDIRLKSNGIEKGWVKLIPTVLKLYNSTPHSSTEISPNEAKNKKNELLVLFNLQNKATYSRKYPPISIQSHVRKYKKPDNFSGRKATVSRWSDNVYQVIDIKDGLYFIDDGIQRGYLRHDLLSIDDAQIKPDDEQKVIPTRI